MKAEAFQFFGIITAIIVISGALGQRFVSFADNGVHWDYDDVNGWKNSFPHCGGKHQSPINMITHGPDSILNTAVFYPHLDLTDYNKRLNVLNLTNNGHTATLTVNESISVSGGYLGKASFRFTQLHFHWGSNDTLGSEHQRNGLKYPIEMHFVHYNNKYPNLFDASNHKDGILVFGVWGQINTTSVNPSFSLISSELWKIKEANSQYKVVGNFTSLLRNLLPSNVDSYYQYQGSLTTPDCSESVTWIMFVDAVNLSKKHLDEFRMLRQGGKNGQLGPPLVNNFRPTQPINGRTLKLILSGCEKPKSLWIILAVCSIVQIFRFIK